MCRGNSIRTSVLTFPSLPLQYYKDILYHSYDKMQRSVYLKDDALAIPLLILGCVILQGRACQDT